MTEHKKECPDCARTKEILQNWIDQQGHDRCWYYPELFEKLVSLFKLTAKKRPLLPPRKEFEEGCRRYQEKEYGSTNPPKA